MLLGKRPRPPMRRTTSMTGISVDIPTFDEHPDDLQPLPFRNSHSSSSSTDSYVYNHFNYHLDNHRFLASMVSPRPIPRRHSADFLTTCGLCKKRLAAGKDIYMYRGDTAFCSKECREKQIKKDEREEKCSAASKKQDSHG